MSFFENIQTFVSKAQDTIETWKGGNDGLPAIDNETEPLQDYLQDVVETKINPVTSQINWGTGGIDNKTMIYGVVIVALILFGKKIFKF